MTHCFTSIRQINLDGISGTLGEPVLSERRCWHPKGNTTTKSLKSAPWHLSEGQCYPPASGTFRFWQSGAPAGGKWLMEQGALCLGPWLTSSQSKVAREYALISREVTGLPDSEKEISSHIQPLSSCFQPPNPRHQGQTCNAEKEKLRRTQWGYFLSACAERVEGGKRIVFGRSWVIVTWEASYSQTVGSTNGKAL